MPSPTRTSPLHCHPRRAGESCFAAKPQVRALRWRMKATRRRSLKAAPTETLREHLVFRNSSIFGPKMAHLRENRRSARCFMGHKRIGAHMAADIRIRVSLTPEKRAILEGRAVAGGTTTANIAHGPIKMALSDERVEGKDEALESLLREQNAKVQEQSARLDKVLAVACANLAVQSWVGKHTLGVACDDRRAAHAANMFINMVPSDVCNMALHMGEHMVGTDGDPRRAMATVCDLPGVDVTLMGYSRDDEWRGAYAANGSLTPLAAGAGDDAGAEG